MEREDDVQLIRSILAGDDAAFSSLTVIKDRLYSAVNRRGIFHISLEE